MSSGYLVVSLLCFWGFWVVGLFLLMRFKDMKLTSRLSYLAATILLLVGTGFFFMKSGFVQKDIVMSKEEFRHELEKSFEDGIKEGAKMKSDYTTIEKEAKIGESIELDSGLAVDVKEVVDHYAESGQVVVDFTIANNTVHHQRFTGYDFSLYDGEGHKGRVTEELFYSETVSPGKKSSGQVVFQTENAGPYEVHFEKNTWSSEK